MADELGRNKANGVVHSKRIVNINIDDVPRTLPNGLPLGTVTYDAAHDVNWVQYRKSWMDGIVPWSYFDPGATTFPEGWTVDTTHLDENFLIENVLEKARQLKADVLLNLAEANQIYPAIQSIANLMPVLRFRWSDVQKLYRKIKSLPRSGKSRDEVYRNAANGFLAWKFGIAPLVRDIRSAVRAIPKLVSELERDGQSDGKRFSEVLELGVLCNTGYVNDYTLNGYSIYGHQMQGTIQAPPTVRYVLVVEPNIKYLTKAFRDLGTIMGRFSTTPASFAWETIPFSFVIDWFVDVRGALRAIDNVLGYSPYKVKSFTRSYGYHLTSSIRLRCFTPCSGAEIFNDNAGTVEYKHYERSVVSSVPTWPRWRPRFGKTQAALTAALMTQQLTKVKR